MWRLSLFRSLIFVLGLAIPGLLAPYTASHSLFLISGCIYARMILEPSISFTAFCLLILMIGDSLGGLRLGSTGCCGLLLAMSAFLGQKYWLSCSKKELYAGYVGHILVIMFVYVKIVPLWSVGHTLIMGGISILLFPWIVDGTRRYLAFITACRHV